MNKYKSDDYKLLVNSTKTSRQFIKIALVEHLELTKIMKMNVPSKSLKSKSKSLKKTKKNKPI